MVQEYESQMCPKKYFEVLHNYSLSILVFHKILQVHIYIIQLFQQNLLSCLSEPLTLVRFETRPVVGIISC